MNMLLVRVMLLFCSCLSVTFSYVQQTSAQTLSPDASAARSAFWEGVAFYKARKYPEALQALKRSYQLSPEVLVRCDIGLLHKELGQHDAAVPILQDCIGDELGDSAPIFRESLDEALKHVGQLRVVVSSPQSVVQVSGRFIEPGKLAWVNAGSQAVDVSATLHHPQRLSVMIEVGASTTEIVHLIPITGYIQISCAHPSGEVFLNGNFIAEAPLTRIVATSVGENELRFGPADIQTVNVEVGKTTSSACQPPAATEASSKRWGYLTVGSGVGLGVAGAAVLIWQEKAARNLNTRELALAPDDPKNPTDDELAALARFNTEHASAKKLAATWRPIGLATLVVGGALSAAGMGILYTDQLNLSVDTQSLAHDGHLFVLSGNW